MQPETISREERLDASLAEAVRRIQTTAKLLFQNSVGCTNNHHGHDTELNGLPGWLRDAEADIARLDALLSSPEPGGEGEQ